MVARQAWSRSLTQRVGGALLALVATASFAQSPAGSTPGASTPPRATPSESRLGVSPTARIVHLRSGTLCAGHGYELRLVAHASGEIAFELSTPFEPARRDGRPVTEGRFAASVEDVRRLHERLAAWSATGPAEPSEAPLRTFVVVAGKMRPVLHPPRGAGEIAARFAGWTRQAIELGTADRASWSAACKRN